MAESNARDNFSNVKQGRATQIPSLKISLLNPRVEPLTEHQIEQERLVSDQYSRLIGAHCEDEVRIVQSSGTVDYTKASWPTPAHSNSTSNDSLHRYYAYTPVTCQNDGKCYLMTGRSERPLPNAPDSFLKVIHLGVLNGNACASPLGHIVHFILDWRSEKNEKPREHDVQIPVPLLDIVRSDSIWQHPTDTQLANLIVRIACDIEALPDNVYCLLSLESIFIINPFVCGGDRPLEFRFCPFSLLMANEKEKPALVSREALMMRTMARFCLQMATRLSDLFVPHLQKRAIIATTRHPGLMMIFMELFEKSRPSPQRILEWEFAQMSELMGPLSDRFALRCRIGHGAVETANPELNVAVAPIATAAAAAHTDPMPSRFLREASPSLLVMTKIGVKQTYSFDQLPALIQMLQCTDSIHCHSPAAEAIWCLLLHATYAHLGHIVGLLSECITALVPKGTALLSDPSSVQKSAPWILRMNIIDRVLFEIIKLGDFARLRRTQQLLLEAGIVNQLGSNLSNMHQSYSLTVIMPIVRVSTLVSFQFSVLQARLIFDRNVVRMSHFAREGCSPPNVDITEDGLSIYVGMMMVMSDFWRWDSNPDIDADKGVIAWMRDVVWRNMKNDTFLQFVLPCWRHSLSDKTMTQLVQKLESCVISTSHDLLKASPNKNECDVLKKRMSYILDWMVSFAWNASEQATLSSHQSLYTSYFVGLIFRRMMPFIIVNSKASTRSRTLLLNDDSDFTSDALDAVQHRWAVGERDARLSSWLSLSHEESNVENALRAKLFTQIGVSGDFGRSIKVHFCQTRSDNALLKACLEDLEYSVDPVNPEALPWMMHIPRDPVTTKVLLGFVKLHRDASVGIHYVPNPDGHGAPSSFDHVFLELPPDRLDLENHREDSVGCATNRRLCCTVLSLNQRDMKLRLGHSEYKRFEPVTLFARQRLCHTFHSSPKTGTTGMFEVRIVDSGDFNQIMVGITWHLNADQLRGRGKGGLNPGRSLTSIGLDLSSGCVFYKASNGSQIKLPYIVPNGTGARVCIGIAHRFVYFVVDGVFYPPLPDPIIGGTGFFTLPEHVDIHGLVRFGCGGIKLMTRALTHRWTLEKHEDGTLKDMASNPLAYMLYLAEQNSMTCPHLHASKKNPATRSNVPDILRCDELRAVLDPSHLELIERIKVAHDICTKSCTCPAYLTGCIDKVVIASRTVT